MLKLSQSSKKIKSFLKRSTGDKLLLLKSFILCGLVRIFILLIPFKRLKKHIGIHNEESSFDIDNSHYKFIKKVAWAVNRASQLTPWQSKCLVQAITAQRILMAHNIYSTLYLGLAKGGEKEIIAHAWLRSGALIVTGYSEMGNFKEVARFSNEK
jgi:hypothetical protein